MQFQGNVRILDRNLHTVNYLSDVDGAVAFDPNLNILYAGSSTGNQVIAFDTNIWIELYRVDIGESLGGTVPFGNGEMQVSNDSTRLFVSTPTGVRVLSLRAMPSPTPLHSSTKAILPLTLGSGLYIPANEPAGPPILVPIGWELSLQVPYGSQVTEWGENTAIVDHPFKAPTQGSIIASARGQASGRHGDLLDDFNAFLTQDWIFRNATNSATK
jgi:hypothetical protein